MKITKQNKIKEDKMVEDFIKDKERTEKFIREELESRKSSIRERMFKEEVCA